MGSSITRRGFVGGAALAAGASLLAVGGTAVASEDMAWDYEADVVAVGAGGAGLSCAIESRDQGLSVVLLESQAVVGGSSRLCNGGIQMPDTPLQREQGIEDSPEIMYEDLVTLTQQDNNPDWIRVHCENAQYLWDWLTGFGLEFRKESLIATQGQSRPREHHAVPADVIGRLEEVALEKGAQILMETHADNLVQDLSTGRVIGVVATGADGSQVAVKADKAVVLTAGGFARNTEMLNHEVFGVGAENIICFAGTGDDGSGIQMALKVGAGTRHMSYISLLTGQNPKGLPGQSCSMMNVGAVCVNREGLRFANEAQGYGNLWTDVAAQTDGECFQVWDDALAQQYAENDSSLYSMEKIEATGLLLKADTYEELAGLMGVPAEAFAETMERYNSDVAETGVDSAFGRETIVSANGTPFPLDTPPFYAFETGNVIYSTLGGLHQGTDAHVLDVYGEPIPGLYCAGGITIYSNFGIVPLTRRGVGASGCGFGGAMIWGRYAAQQIAATE